MNLIKQIKKMVCTALIILISFILAMNKIVYSSSIDEPIILEPTDSQYIELRAVRSNEIEGEDYQVLIEIWAHGLETTGFTFRVGFDNTILQTSNLEDNSYSNNSEEYFKFEDSIEKDVDMDALGIAEDESSLLFIISVLDNKETDNQYIVEKENVGMVLDSTTEDVLIGTMSFRSKTKLLEADAITLKPSEDTLPKTGIKVMANKYDYYENEKLFKFTLDLVSTNAKLGNLTTDLKEITNFDRDTYEYTIQIPANKREITIFPTPEETTSVVKIAGKTVDVETGIKVSIPGFSEMSNTTKIKIIVTAEDGISTKTYTLIIEKLGGFLQGEVLTANTTGTHYSTIKVYKSDLKIDWKTLNSVDLEEYEIEVEVNTYDDGFFQTILPVGKYDILIDKAGYLDHVIKEVEIYQQTTTSIGTKQIIPGDVNKDGKVNPIDKTYFLAGYNSAEGSEKYDIRYDYIEDGKVNPLDKTIFLANYNKSKIIE